MPKMKYLDLDINGCMEIYGSHIKLCIKDYAEVHNHVDRIEAYIKKSTSRVRKNKLNVILQNYQSAKKYLFGDGLRYAIDAFMLDINLEYTQRFATECAKEGRLITRGTTRTYNLDDVYADNNKQQSREV